MIYSVNSFSSAGSRKGMSGLMSGLDTDELVKQMTIGTRTKIATQLQKKQQAGWKQAAYREITSKINAFQNKYLSYSSGKNNILSPNFFKTSTITNTSPYLKVSGDANAAKNIVVEDIMQLAQTERFTTSKTFSSQNITSDKIYSTWTDATVAGSSLNVEYGGETHAISIDRNFKFSSNTLTDEEKITELVDSLNKSIIDNENLVLKDVDGNILGGKVSIGLEGGLIKITNTSGDDTNIKLTGGTVSLLEGLGLNTGMPEGTSLTGVAIDLSKMTADKVLNEVLAGTTISLAFNGVERTINFNESEKELFQDAGSLTSYLQNAINKAYGANKITVTNTDGALRFETTEPTSIFTIKSSDTNGVLGKNGALNIQAGTSTRALWNVSLKDMASQMQTPLTAIDGKYKLTINDVTLEFKETDTMNEVLSKINNSSAGVRLTYSTTTDTFSLSSKESGAQGRVDIANSGAENDLAYSLFGDASHQTKTEGMDAILQVSFDGGATSSTVVRSTNSFSLDGLNIELLGKAEGDQQENITFGSENNVDELVEKMQEFFKDYNELIKLCSDKIGEKKEANFTALTDEQKAEMTEKEVENWEAKAKQGLLSNDSNINRFLVNLRSAMNNAVDGTSSALFKIGIKSTNWKENGQLHIDETALRKALAENPEEITKLFTNLNEDDPSKAGLSTRLSAAMNAMAGTFGGDGILIKIAGKIGDSSTGQDRLSLQMKQMDKQLSNLKTILQTQEQRYYKQFSQLETYLSRLSAQSEWLNSQNNNQQQ